MAICAEAVVRVAALPAEAELIIAKCPDVPVDTKLVRVKVLPLVKVVVVSPARVIVL